jgi:hypothetical protein
MKEVYACSPGQYHVFWYSDSNNREFFIKVNGNRIDV